MEADISIKSVFNEAAGSSKLYNTSPSNENENRIVGTSISRVSDAHLNALYNTLFDPSLSDNHKIAMCLGYLTYNPEEGSEINNDNLYQAIELEDLLQSIRQEIAQRQITLSNSSNVRMLEKKLELVNSKYDEFQEEVLPLSNAVSQLSSLRDEGGLEQKIETVRTLVEESNTNQDTLSRAHQYKSTLSNMIESSKDRLNKKIENSVLPSWLMEIVDEDIPDTERALEHDKQALKDVTEKITDLESRQDEINDTLSSDEYSAIKSLIDNGLTDYASAQAKIVNSAQSFANGVAAELNESVALLTEEQRALDKLYGDIQNISKVFSDFEVVLNQSISKNLILNSELEEKVSESNENEELRAQRFKYQFVGREIDRFLFTLNNIKSNILPIQAELSMQADAVNELKNNNLNAISSAQTLSVSGFSTAASKITPLVNKIRINVANQNNAAISQALSLSGESSEVVLNQRFNDSVHNITSENKRIHSLIDEIADLHLDVSDESDGLRSGLAESLRLVMKARTMIESIRDSAAAHKQGSVSEEDVAQSEEETTDRFSQAGSRVLRDFGPNI